MASLSNIDYWQRRYLQVKAKEIRDTEVYERALQPELNGLFRDLNSEMEGWYVRYANNNGITKEGAAKILNNVHTKHWQLTLKQFEEKAKAGGHTQELNNEYYRSRVARLQALEQQMKQHTARFAGNETNHMRDALAEQYDDTYMRTTFNTQVQTAKLTADFARFNEAQLKIAISQPWGKDGKDFSKRIWKNYQEELPSYLMDAVMRGTFLGWSPQRITTQMHARFQDVKRNNIHRLVVSEMGHAASEATAKSYEENEIEEYEYMATLESHTCEVCAKLDGQIFKVSDRKPGINYPLIHARCRCDTVPHIKGLPDVQQRWMRDSETGKGKLIKNMKFDEWKNLVSTGKNIPVYASKPQGKPKIDIRAILSTKNVDKLNELTPNGAELFVEHLQKAPREMQELYYNYRDQINIKAVNNGGGSYFRGMAGQITYDSKSVGNNDFKDRNNIDVVFHEMAHAIDSKGKFGKYKGKRFLKRSTKEVEIEKVLDHSTDAQYNLYDSIRQEGLEAAHIIVEEYDPEYGYYETAAQEWSKNHISKDGSEWIKYGDVSDMMEGATNGSLKLGMGHGSSYWRQPVTRTTKVNNGHLENEFFAECTAATINNPESLKMIKKMFPESYKIYQKIVADMNKEKRNG